MVFYATAMLKLALHMVLLMMTEKSTVLEESANANVSGEAVREVFANMLMFVVRFQNILKEE